MRTSLTILILAVIPGLAACNRSRPQESQAPPASESSPAPQPGDPGAEQQALQPQQSPTPPPPGQRGVGAPSPARAAAPAAASQERAASAAAPEPRAPLLREVTIPDGTTLAVRLDTGVASDTSNVEDRVRATLTRAVRVDDRTVLPAGTTLVGTVTEAVRSGKVKGRARVAFRFTTLVLDDTQYEIRSSLVSRQAPATKRKDATKVGIGAGAGAVVGAIIGGGRGAAIGAGTGAGAGTAVALSTRGDEVRLPEGTAVSVKLSQPLVVTVEETPQR